MEGLEGNPWDRPVGWVAPPEHQPGAPGGWYQPAPPAPRHRRNGWGIAAVVSFVMVLIGPPLGIALSFWYDSAAGSPQPEGEGPQEAWFLLAFAAGIVVWCAAWLVVAVVCAIVAGTREGRRSRHEVS